MGYCVECSRRRGDNASRYASRRVRVAVFILSLPVRLVVYAVERWRAR